MSIDEIITSIRSLTPDNDEDYILYPNPNYTPITDTLPDGTLVAYDAVTDMWSTRDMRIYRKATNGTWIKKFISVWEKFVRKENMHSRYPQVRATDKPHEAHLVTVRAWIGPVPPGYQTDHIDGNNRNFSIDNLRLLPTWMNHRDGGFIKKLRNKKIDPGAFSQRNGRSGLRLRGEPNLYVRNMLLRFFQRMALFKSTNPDYRYNTLSHDDLLRLLVEPEFKVEDPAKIMEYEMTHHMEC